MCCALLTGCGGMGHSNGGPAPALPSGSAAAADTIRVGDTITIRLTGVPDGGYVVEIQISPAGTITVPLLTQAFPAAGLTASQLANNISDSYKSSKIYTNPHVVVLPEVRYVNVGGDVRSPMRVQYTPDLTLLSTVNSCGGFDEYADRRHVRVVRGGQIFQVDCVAVSKNLLPDPPVYPGDEITVPRTPF